MMISDEQVRRVVAYLQTTEYDGALRRTPAVTAGISPELIAEVCRVLECTPDMRDDRIAAGREMLTRGPIPSAEIADKMIARIISDSLR